MQVLRRRLSKLILFSQIILAILIVRNWLYVTTYRLYVEDRIDPTSQDGSVWQQFNVQDKTVLPQIFAEGNARLRFAVRFPKPTTLWVNASPSGRASYQIYLLEDGSRNLLAQRTLKAPSLDRVLLPPGDGVLEITSQGSLTWSDLRIVRGWDALPHLIVFFIFALLWIGLRRAQPAGSASVYNGRRPVQLFMGVAITGSCVLTFILDETVMRLFGPPASLSALRRELGEISQDPQ